MRVSQEFTKQGEKMKRLIAFVILAGIAAYVFLGQWADRNSAMHDAIDRTLDLLSNQSPIVWIVHTNSADGSECILPDVYTVADLTWSDPYSWQQDDTSSLQYSGSKKIRIQLLNNQFIEDVLGGVFSSQSHIFEGKHFTLRCEANN